MKQRKIIGTVLTICVLLLSLAGCAGGFEGESVKNADSYILDIESMNGTDSHTLELEQGDTLQIYFETVEGSLSMEITDPDGTVIYQGDGTEATEFTVDIHADGAYTISVEGEKAEGSIRVDVKKAPAEGEGMAPDGSEVAPAEDEEMAPAGGEADPPEDEGMAPAEDGGAAPEEGEEVTPEEEPWKTAFEADLLEKYEVTPEYYEDLGDGIYQVYVEIDGKVVPFVTVNSATGDYHG